jgi:hypothetical protein
MFVELLAKKDFAPLGVKQSFRTLLSAPMKLKRNYELPLMFNRGRWIRPQKTSRLLDKSTGKDILASERWKRPILFWAKVRAYQPCFGIPGTYRRGD